MPLPWSSTEVELIIEDYFSMFEAELKGAMYTKSTHRHALLPLLNHRSDGSVEFKYQNISAVLANYGQPYIKGYLPRYNYQHMLEEKVLEFLNAHLELENLFKNFVDKKIVEPLPSGNYDNLLVNPPEQEKIHEYEPAYKKNPFKVNYLEKEQNNRNLGVLGEEMIMEYEKWNLIRLGKDKLADQIRWIAKEEGDGAGFDILSKHDSGKDKYIEVKTTRLSKKTPIFFSRNELEFSIAKHNDFYLYRLFNFEEDPKFFIRNGALNRICQAEPVNYKGYF